MGGLIGSGAGGAAGAAGATGLGSLGQLALGLGQIGAGIYGAKQAGKASKAQIDAGNYAAQLVKESADKQLELQKQNLSSINDIYNRFSKRSNLINIPRSKFLLFRTGKHRGDPFGKSPLRDAYLAWRFLTALEELEATGVAKDLNGLPVNL